MFEYSKSEFVVNQNTIIQTKLKIFHKTLKNDLLNLRKMYLIKELALVFTIFIMVQAQACIFSLIFHRLIFKIILLFEYSF